MSARIQRFSTLAVLTAAIAFFAVPGFASAEERAHLRPGVYPGTWHGDKVSIIVEKVSTDGTFSGNVHFDPSSRWPNYRFDLAGVLERNGSITIRRVNDNCDQVAHTSAPRRMGKDLAWCGQVTGAGLDGAYPFELRMPAGR